MKIPILLLAALGAAAPLAAQFQLRSLDGLAAKAKQSTEITLDSATLKSFLSNGANQGKGDQANKILTGLKSLTVRAYEFAEAKQYDPNSLRPIRDQLRAPAWTKIMDIKDGGETFELYSRTEQGKNTGFAMLAAEPKELTVIYIEGSLDLSDVANLGGQFGIPKLPKDKKGKE